MYAHPDRSVSGSIVGFQLLKKNYQIAKDSNSVVDGLLYMVA